MGGWVGGGLSESVVMVDMDSCASGGVAGCVGGAVEWKGERMVDSGPLHRLQVGVLYADVCV
jgi:hypothetical protein